MKLMDLQMHNSYVISQASLSCAVTAATLDLPDFLKQKGRGLEGKNGYQLIGLVDQAKEREAPDKQAEMILEQDGLVKFDPDEILKICVQKYEDANMKLRAAQLKESQQLRQEGSAQPELQKQQGSPR